jgi:hypothetical protein
MGAGYIVHAQGAGPLYLVIVTNIDIKQDLYNVTLSLERMKTRQRVLCTPPLLINVQNVRIYNPTTNISLSTPQLRNKQWREHHNGLIEYAETPDQRQW